VTGKSIALFVAAALAEIGGAYLVWIGLRNSEGFLLVALGVAALGLYGVVAALQPENEFGRIRAAIGLYRGLRFPEVGIGCGMC